MMSEITDKCFKTGPYSTAKIRVLQDCVAMSVIAEFLLKHDGSTSTEM